MKKLLFILLLIFFTKTFAQTPSETLRKEVKERIFSGEYDKAISLLEKNISSIQSHTTGLFDALIDLYFFERNWGAIIKSYTSHKFQLGEDSTSLSMAKFYINTLKEKISLKETVKIPFKPSVSGTPIIEVKVNGHLYHFWFDTGAGMTALSSTVAWDCKIKAPMKKYGIAMAATGNTVNINPGLIDTLEINNLKVYNHPCLILDKKDLEFRILGIRILKIDGVIGWNLLQQLDVTVNNKTDSIILASAEMPTSRGNNFFWFEQPLIKCSDTAGVASLFFIDTGADHAGVYEPFLSKVDTIKAKKKTMKIGSAGGFKKIRSFTFPVVKLNVGGELLIMKNVSQNPTLAKNLFPCDGVLGINEFKNRIINFNMRKGVFTISH